jgi:hypothetical protein
MNSAATALSSADFACCGGLLRGALKSRALVVLLAFVCAVVSCGGTTGREDLPPPNLPSGTPGDATVPEGGADATLPQGTSDGGESFDVVIQYADQVLPDLQAPAQVDASTSTAVICAPDIPAVIAVDGGITLLLDGDISAQNFEVPAEFLDGGEQATAPPGSPCATHVWTYSAACDACLRFNQYGTSNWLGQYGPAELPPCSDLAEAGVATTGLMAGTPRVQICQNLFSCLLSTGCFTGTSGLVGCYCKEAVTMCNMNGGDGVCYPQELAAMEIGSGSPGAIFTQVTLGLNAVSASPTPSSQGHGAVNVNQTMLDMLTPGASGCRALCIADGGGAP